MSADNWGRWGDDDERGSVNLCTPERVLAALATATRGVVVPIGSQVGKRGLIGGGRNPTWHVTTTVRHPEDAGRGRAEDVLVMHTHAHSHMDGLSHVWYDDKLYKDFDAMTVGRGGTRHLSIANVGGIVARGALLDVSGPDVAWSAGDLIGAAKLAAAADRAGIEVDPGDAVLIRTGWTDDALSGGEHRWGDPGLGPDAVDWLAERAPVLIGMDTGSIEPVPAPEGTNPLLAHETFLRDRGMYLLEFLDLRGVAAHRATAFALIVAPLLVDRGLGSPVNPLAVL